MAETFIPCDHNGNYSLTQLAQLTRAFTTCCEKKQLKRGDISGMADCFGEVVRDGPQVCMADCMASQISACKEHCVPSIQDLPGGDGQPYEGNPLWDTLPATTSLLDYLDCRRKGGSPRGCAATLLGIPLNIPTWQTCGACLAATAAGCAVGCLGG